MIKPKEMLEQANAQSKKPQYICLEEYGESIHILYTKKNMTYNEVREWLRERNKDYSVASISRAHQTWRLKNGIK